MEYKEIEGRIPEKVFKYFQEISQIPRGSGNTKEISDYLVAFAKERRLSWYQDDANNVIIKKAATEGYENAPVTMLQGHIDMVCQVESGKTHDFTKDPISLILDGDIIHADGTTLGGDDGIAVAYALAVLDSDDIAHPALECVFTSDEEIGMIGASALDYSRLKSRYMLNMDSENEGTFLAGCAGGVHAGVHIPFTSGSGEGVLTTIELKGLTGGHSGTDITRGRACATVLSGRILQEIGDAGCELDLVSLESGLADNAISRSAVIKALSRPEDKEKLEDAVGKLDSVLKDEYHVTDPKLALGITFGEVTAAPVLSEKSFRDAVCFILNTPQGIQKMSQDLPDQVETSLNLGILKVDANELAAGYLLRSSRATGKQALVRKLQMLVENFGGTYTAGGDYPAWEFLTVSPLRDLVVSVYEEQSGKKAKVENIHAGVECGLFTSAVEGLDAVSFGPDMQDIHSPSERISVSSIDRTYKMLVEVLKKIK